MGKNHGWTHSSEGTFTITGATENVTLLYYGYPQSFVNTTDFFADHSVILTSTFSFGIIMLLAIYINKRKSWNKFGKKSRSETTWAKE